MGCGIGYRYEHFLLFDADEISERIYGEPFGWSDFVTEILSAFAADKVEKKYISRNAFVIGETTSLTIGIDSSGGSPCIFLIPKTFTRFNSDKEIEYSLSRKARRGFNRLIKSQPEGFFRRPTSSWTSESVTRYL